MKLGASALWATLLMSVSALTLAQQPPASGGGGGGSGGASEFIKGMDKDGDGKLSKTEVAGTPLEADFADIDTNKDGKLEAKELESFTPKNVGGGGSQPPAQQ